MLEYDQLCIPYRTYVNMHVCEEKSLSIVVSSFFLTVRIYWSLQRSFLGPFQLDECQANLSKLHRPDTRDQSTSTYLYIHKYIIHTTPYIGGESTKNVMRVYYESNSKNRFGIRPFIHSSVAVLGPRSRPSTPFITQMRISGCLSTWLAQATAVAAAEWIGMEWKRSEGKQARKWRRFHTQSTVQQYVCMYGSRRPRPRRPSSYFLQQFLGDRSVLPSSARSKLGSESRRIILSHFNGKWKLNKWTHSVRRRTTTRRSLWLLDRSLRRSVGRSDEPPPWER